MGILGIFLAFISFFSHPTLKVGEPAPNLILNDINGQPIALHSLKGRIVLVDFWASWCGPCRAANEDVVEIYNNYHAKGFDIYSVSLDKKKEAWQKAVKDDKLVWKNHVSDFQEWNSPAALLYHVEALPATFLIDENGIIIAIDIEPYDLENKLKKLLDQKWRIFPKATSNTLYFSEKVSYAIVDAQGKEVAKGKESQVLLETLPVGEYTVQSGGQKWSFTKKENMHVQPVPELVLLDKSHYQLTHESNYEVYTTKGILMKSGKGFLISMADLPSAEYIISVDHHVYKVVK